MPLTKSPSAATSRCSARVGVTGHYAYAKQRVGLGCYAKNLLAEIFKLERSFRFILYLDGTEDPALIPTDQETRILKSPLSGLWTHGRLPLSLIGDCPDLFFYTAQSVPLFPPHRSVVTIHDLIYRHAPGRTATDRLRFELQTRAAARVASRILVDSRHTRDDIVAFCGADPDKIAVILLACDHERFHSHHDRAAIEAVCRRYGLEWPYLLYVGSTMAHKNLPRLIQAFATAREQRRLPHHLVLAGPFWGDDTALNAEIARAGTGSVVHRTGLVPDADLPLLYAGAAALAYPSLYEGFGLPLLEAMASGTPVVSSRRACIPEIAGDAALLVNPEDVPELASALGEVLTVPALAQSLRVAGLARAAEFTWRRTAQQTLAVLEDELERRRR